MSNPVLSVIVPMYNEQEVIEQTQGRLSAVLEKLDMPWEIIYVNDGSRDGTLNIVLPWAKADERIRLVDFSRNFGHQAAVTAGLHYARGQAIVIIDADLQDPPELIPKMVERWQAGMDVVYGKRQERKGETAFKKFTAAMFYRTMHYLTDGVVPRDTGDFRLIDRKVRDALCAMPERSRFIRGMVAWVGFRQEPLMYVRDARAAGVTKYPLKKMLKLASDGIFSFSHKPLKLLQGLGILAMAASALGALCSWIIHAIAGSFFNSTFVVLAALIGFCTGVLLFGMGVTGSYIGRIFEESKGRPHYLVRTDPDENFRGEAKRG